MNKDRGITGNVKIWLLIGVGSFFVGLGILGIFLPLLPTTPFLLLAAACYIRSSRRFYDWLLTNRWLGSYIRDYREGNGISLVTKVTVIALLWLTIGYSAVFVVPVFIGKIVLCLIAIGVTIHLLSIKTLNRNRATSDQIEVGEMNE